MSRHRNVRQMRYDEEYDDYYSTSYGKSYEEEISVSPETARKYLYNGPDSNNSVFDFDKSEPDQIDGESIETCDSQVSSIKSQFVEPTDPLELAKLLSCVSEMQNVCGETISEIDLKIAAIKYNYNYELALSSVLSGEQIVLTDKPKSKSRFQNNDSTREGPQRKQEKKKVPKVKEKLEILDKDLAATPDKSTNKIKTDKTQPQRSDAKKTLPVEKPIKIVDQISSPKLKTKKFDPKSNIKEFEETRSNQKETINLVVIGHVDAGKSTLMGHLMVKMGYVSAKKLHSYEFNSKKIGKSSFMYAWVLDQTEEERNSGVTIDVAQATFETETKNVTLLDAPGHKDFIPNMITGASQADAAILVVDATTKEFESGFNQGGQTKEHTMLVKSLGISQLAVAVNKLDNVNWSEERFREIEIQLKPFLKQVGFKVSSVPFVPCSGLNGENLNEKSKIEQLSSWFVGPCLLDVIDQFKSVERSLDKNLRFYVNNVYKQIGQSGVFVSGKVESGAIRVNQKLTIRPNNETCVVKNIQSDDKIVQTAFAGDQVDICLSNVEEISLFTGVVLCEPDSLIPVVSRLQARIVTFNTLSIPITNGFDIVFHYKSLCENATVLRLIASLDKSNGEVIRKFPRCLIKNSSGLVDIQLSKPICLELYQNFKELGRFMLRYKGLTIAAGIIEKLI